MSKRKTSTGSAILLGMVVSVLLRSYGGDVVDLIFPPHFIEVVQSGDTNEVKKYINEGADVNALGPDGNLPLDEAISQGHTEMARILVDAGAVAGAGSHQLLYEVILQDDTEAVRILIDAGTYESVSFIDLSPLHLQAAVSKGNAEVVQILIDAGADVSATSRDPTSLRGLSLGSAEDSLLHAAISQGNTEVVQILIDAGADVDATDSRGYKPLDEAIWQERAEIQRILVEAGAYTVSYDHKSVDLHRAVQEGGVDRVKKLIAEGADVNAKDRRGNPLLYEAINEAIYGSNAEIVRLFIGAGANVNDRNSSGASPLMAAMAPAKATNMMQNYCRDLAEKEEVFAKSGYLKPGNVIMTKPTPCPKLDESDEAVQVNALEVMRILIEAGADVDGYMVDFAESQGFTDVAQLLKDAGAQD